MLEASVEAERQVKRLVSLIQVRDNGSLCHRVSSGTEKRLMDLTCNF